MKKTVTLFLAVMVLSTFSWGCGGFAKENNLKFSKHRVVFTVDEAIQRAEERP